MHTTHRLAFPFAGALALVCLGCATTLPSRNADGYRDALLASVTHIERRSSPRASNAAPTPLTLVVSSATPEALRQACSAIRSTVYDYNLPDTDTLSLPSLHLQPQSLVITGDTAVFKGLLGPVPLAGAPASPYACGTTYRLQLLRHADGSWQVTAGSTELCRLLLPRASGGAA